MSEITAERLYVGFLGSAESWRYKPIEYDSKFSLATGHAPYEIRPVVYFVTLIQLIRVPNVRLKIRG